MKHTVWHKALLVVCVVGVVVGLAVNVVGASTGAPTGQGRSPFAALFKDLYDEGIGTWLPFLALVMLIGTVANGHFGWVSMGEGLSRLVFWLVILFLGVAGIVDFIGIKSAAGATLF